MEPAFQPLKSDQLFRFACHPGVPCFNQCCRDLTQLLTPYDILRLKNHLELSSAQFLNTHTIESTGPQSGLPIIALKPVGPQRLCPFVSERGCTVYPDRPASCRIYPLARGMGLHPVTGEPMEQFALIREPHCHGFAPVPPAAHQKQSANQWVAGQGLGPYNEMNDLMLDLIQQKRRRLGKTPLDPGKRKAFHLALYNLDDFRACLTEGRAPIPSMLIENAAAALRGDDDDLLHFAIQWVKTVLLKA